MKEEENGNKQPMQIELQVVRGETSGMVAINEEKQTVVLSDDMSFDQWREVIRTIRFIKRKAAIAVADCISFGIKKWGTQKVNEALEQLELEATLVKSAIAINTIPRELRLENLEGDHYVELAKASLTKSKAIKWARIASEQHLTPSQLRFSIQEGSVVDRAAARELQTGMITIQGIRQSFDIWLRRVGGLEGIKKMELDHQIEIMEEMDAICQLGMELHNHLAQVNEAVTA